MIWIKQQGWIVVNNEHADATHDDATHDEASLTQDGDLPSDYGTSAVRDNYLTAEYAKRRRWGSDKSE